MNKLRQFHEERLVIASHNAGKIAEISALLKLFKVQTISSAALGLEEPAETGTTYLENALIKARACVVATGLVALSDDSGLEVEALGGEPGLHTAPFTKANGGRENVFAMWAANPKIAANPKATFIGVQVLAWPDGHYEQFEGIVKGHLTFPPRGQGGHGYDPVFIPENHDCTLAQMAMEEKHNCSHRGIALQKLIAGCFKG